VSDVSCSIADSESLQADRQTTVGFRDEFGTRAQSPSHSVDLVVFPKTML